MPMSSPIRVAGRALTVPLLLLLAACSSGPGPADIKQAMGHNGQIMNGLSVAMGLDDTTSPEEVIAAVSVEVGSCVPAKASDGYVCDYQVSRTVDGQTMSSSWARARFFRTSPGWQMAT
jgi:hypothetical protein